MSSFSSASSSCRIDVLVPTCDRACALAVTLAGLAAQDFDGLRVVISDQSEGGDAFETLEVRAMLRILEAQGREVETHRHLPRKGMAEQRAFLLSRASAPYCLFLDDDVFIEPDLVQRLQGVIVSQKCGFVGSALHGLSFAEDARPEQERIEFWNSPVRPERIEPESTEWDRHHLHNAANLFRVQSRLGVNRCQTQLYHIAWIGGCVLYDTAKLRAVGGFDFWRELPAEHCGEDVLAQLRLMCDFGGCGIVPSGAYHLELPTTIPRREVDAPKVLAHSASLSLSAPPAFRRGDEGNSPGG